VPRKPNIKNLTPFPKGTSGNPAGRPKGALNRSTLVEKWITATKSGKNPLTEQIEELQVQDLMTLSLIGRAMKGDVNAYKELMDSAYGKVTTDIDIKSGDEPIQPATVVFKKYNPDDE
jgi:hypothetical protein